jgi:hypothetical protein
VSSESAAVKEREEFVDAKVKVLGCVIAGKACDSDE